MKSVKSRGAKMSKSNKYTGPRKGNHGFSIISTGKDAGRGGSMVKSSRTSSENSSGTITEDY